MVCAVSAVRRRLPGSTRSGGRRRARCPATTGLWPGVPHATSTNPTKVLHVVPQCCYSHRRKEVAPPERQPGRPHREGPRHWKPRLDGRSDARRGHPQREPNSLTDGTVPPPGNRSTGGKAGADSLRTPAPPPPLRGFHLQHKTAPLPTRARSRSEVKPSHRQRWCTTDLPAPAGDNRRATDLRAASRVGPQTSS